jgi:hypothetical protein
MMPPVSQQQRKAMHAAAEGNSTLDIPKKVGKEFVASDEGGSLPKRAPSGRQFNLPKSGKKFMKGC